MISSGTLQCIELPGHSQCVCHQGYTGQLCNVDINECVTSSCLNGGSCVDKVDGSECNCVGSYGGNYSLKQICIALLLIWPDVPNILAYFK